MRLEKERGLGMKQTLARTVLLPFLLAACATTGNPKDPLEPLNRQVFAFNDTVDTYALQPVARGYVKVVPTFVRTGVGNVFSNLEDALIGVNNLLQGKPTRALGDLGRLVLNSSIGLFGVFDVATPFGLEKHDEDFGQTLGAWGFGSGPYFVLPFLGPSSLRDTSNLGALFLDPTSSISRIPVRNSVKGLRLIDARAQLLEAGQALEEAALDKYVFMRDFYLQRRESQVYDGNPPRQRERFEDEEPLDESSSEAPIVEPSAPSSAQTGDAAPDRAEVISPE